MKRRLLLILPLLFISFLTLAALIGIRPINISRENSLEITGLVTGISEGGTKDAVIILSGPPKIFYINRGYERGLTLKGLRSKLIGKHVKISFAKHWSIFNFAGESRHITELKLGEELVFSELN